MPPGQPILKTEVLSSHKMHSYASARRYLSIYIAQGIQGLVIPTCLQTHRGENVNILIHIST